MDNATRFINAFTKIERYMKTIVDTNNYTKFYRLVSVCKKKNHVIKVNEQKLLDYASLRNVMIHQRDDENQILAIPTDSVVDDIEKISENIDYEKNILEFASTPIITAFLEETVNDTYKKLKKIGTSKIPVYDGNFYFGLITLEDVAEAFFNNQGEVKVKEIVKNSDNKVLFFHKDRSIDEVVDAFEENIKKGNTLKAIVVVDNGKPVGIITAYDLPKIMSYFI